MNDLDDETLTYRQLRLFQSLGCFGMLHAAFASWYLPAVSGILLPALCLVMLCVIGMQFKLACLRSQGFFSWLYRVAIGAIGTYGYFMLVGVLAVFLMDGGSRTTADERGWQFGFLAIGVVGGLVPLPRRVATAMIALGVLLPFTPDAAEACYGHAIADPQPCNYAAYMLFLMGSVRLFTYAANRYHAEGLDEPLPEIKPRVRRALGPIADIAPIRAPLPARPRPAAPRPPVRTATRPVRFPLKLAGARCPVCACGLDGRVVTCTTCATPHHADCFAFSAACATYACGSEAAVTLA